MLRILNLVLCVAMLAVAASQFNRPDGWLWAGCFVVPAFWAFIAGFRHRAFGSVRWLGWLWGCVAAWLVLLWRYWPQRADFWRPQVWLHDAVARSSLGLVVAVATLVVALLTAYQKR